MRFEENFLCLFFLTMNLKKGVMVEKIEEPAPEQFLYRIWSDEHILHRKLVALDGRPIEVIYRGRRNPDSGPDYLDAHLSLGNRLVRGDIEIDPVASDWYNHGHHKNSLYNNVVLHIVTMYCPAAAQTIRQDGQSVPILNLDAFLEVPSEQMAASEADSADWLKPRSGACTLSQKDVYAIGSRLEFYGQERFRIKTARFVEERLTDSWEQCFYRALLEALGYSKNQIPFLRLANLLPIEKLREQIWQGPPGSPIVVTEAYLFGAAGLLPSQNANLPLTPDRKSLAYIERLEAIWSQWDYRRKIDPLPRDGWLFFRLRPQNFPTRRIAAAARIVVQFMEHGFLAGFARILLDDAIPLTKLAREVERRLLVVDDLGFWHRHYSFDETIPESGARTETRLVGAERARNIIINVLLPVLQAFAGETENHLLRNRTVRLFARLPRESENVITRLMRQRVFGTETGGLKQANLAIHQQGLLHLAKNLCLDDDCDRCWRGPAGQVSKSV